MYYIPRGKWWENIELNKLFSGKSKHNQCGFPFIEIVQVDAENTEREWDEEIEKNSFKGL